MKILISMVVAKAKLFKNWESKTIIMRPAIVWFVWIKWLKCFGCLVGIYQHAKNVESISWKEPNSAVSCVKTSVNKYTSLIRISWNPIKNNAFLHTFSRLNPNDINKKPNCIYWSRFVKNILTLFFGLVRGHFEVFFRLNFAVFLNFYSLWLLLQIEYAQTH